MSTMPPQKDEPDDMDDEYRRWSSNDTARPADSVRTAVMANAVRLAEERRAALAPKLQRRLYRWAAPVFGGLAAATLVGFLVIPRFIDQGRPAGKTTDALIARDMQSTLQLETDKAVTPVQAPAPAVAANLPSQAREKVESRPAENSSSAADLDKSFAETGALARRSQQEAPSGILAGRAADSAPSAASAPPAAFMPRAEFTATAGHNIDTGDALRRSANLGDLQGVTALLSGKIDIESRDSAGRTALMLAASSGRATVVTALLARGADPNATDSYGDTPLHAALAGNYAEIAEALKRAGAR